MKNKTVKKRAEKLEIVSVYSTQDYESNDGMLVSVWGPSAWHFLHTMSFNYPVHPTEEQKKHYMDFVLSLQNVLPCGKCRKNLVKNFKKLPLTMKEMENRDKFSRYLYNLHEVINKMLHKKSNLSYDDVRERYEHFRARCVTPSRIKNARGNVTLPLESPTNVGDLNRQRCKKNKTKKRVRFSKHISILGSDKSKKEKGCVVPLYGEKSKCVLQIVPQDTECETFQIDDKCIKKKLIVE